MSILEHFPKSVKRFSDKKCGENKELEQLVEPSEPKLLYSSAIESQILPLENPRAFLVSLRSTECSNLAD